MKIGCIRMTTLDTLLVADVLPVEDEVISRVESAYRCLGGKGMVTALSVFAQGADVSLFTLVGDSTQIKQRLPMGFCSDYLLEALEANNRTWIPIASHERFAVFVYSSDLLQDVPNSVLNMLRTFVSEIDILYLTTEYMFVVREAARMALECAVPLITNVNSALMSDSDCSDDDLRELLLTFSSTVIMNDHESTQALAKLNLKTWGDVSSSRLKEIVVTKGEEGGVVSSRPFRDWQSFPAYVVKTPVCSVGAGDTFNAGYLVARFVQGKSPLDSCKYGARVAAEKLDIPSSTLYRGVRIV